MYLAVHSVAGGIAGDKLGNPILAFIAGFILHFILDAIPHEYKHDDDHMAARDWMVLLFDCAITAIVWGQFFRPEINFRSNFFWGAIGGIFPDLLDNLPVVKVYFRQTAFGSKFHHFHDAIQKVKVGLFWGRIIEYMILILLIFAVIYP